MDKASAKAKKYMEWLTMPPEERGEQTLAEFLRDEGEGEEVLCDMTEAYWKRQAFAKSEDPGAMQRTADYADEWFAEAGRRFRTYYVCRAGFGSEGPCNTAVLSTLWDTRFQEPDAVKQRWYCPRCGARYKTTFGMLCEIVQPRLANGCESAVAMYMLAPFPPNQLQDAKFMAVEQRFAEANPTPRQLLDAIPTAIPMDRGEVLPPRPGLRGCYALQADRLPKEQLDWNQFFNLKPQPTPQHPPPPAAIGVPDLI